MSDIYKPLSELKKEREAEARVNTGETTTPQPQAMGDVPEAEAIVSPVIPEPPPGSGIVPRTPTTVTRPPVKRYGLQFTGTTGEYFRIWIVNIALTVATLGIYAAWAKVRTRRYFYANTILDGQPFDYLATTGAILKGHLIIGSVMILIQVFNNVLPALGGILSLLLAVFFPFLIYKAHRFKMHNSAYRNIRFRFFGTAGQAYKTYMLKPLLVFGIPWAIMIALAAGLGASGSGGSEAGVVVFVIMSIAISLVMVFAYPYFYFHIKKYSFDNLGFGTKSAYFSPRLKIFVLTFLFAGLLMLGIGAVGAGGFAIIGGVMAAAGETTTLESAPVAFQVIGVVAYILFLASMALVQQYVYSRITNHCLGSLKLGPLQFESTLSARSLAWIRITNLAAIVATLGLAIPWTRVRRTQYVLSKLQLVSQGDLDQFHAGETEELQAMGDAAADFFDMDVGWDLGW